MTLTAPVMDTTWIDAQIAAAQQAVDASAGMLALSDVYQAHLRNVAVLDYLTAQREALLKPQRSEAS